MSSSPNRAARRRLARATSQTGKFLVPDDLMQLHPTVASHSDAESAGLSCFISQVEHYRSHGVIDGWNAGRMNTEHGVVWCLCAYMYSCETKQVECLEVRHGLLGNAGNLLADKIESLACKGHPKA